MKNNKGFSLVELIVVIAIMAVLVGVLAPTLLRYVEKTRIQKDASAVAEVVQAAKISLADETVFTACTATGATPNIKISTAGAITSDVTALQTDVLKTTASCPLSGKDRAAIQIDITINSDGVPSFALSSPADTVTTDWANAIRAAVE